MKKIKNATCERTGNSIRLSDGFFTFNKRTKDWLFLSADAPEKAGDYNIEVSQLVKSPEALVDWIAHLSGKSWFDAKKFCDFFVRFRKENGLYLSL